MCTLMEWHSLLQQPRLQHFYSYSTFITYSTEGGVSWSVKEVSVKEEPQDANTEEEEAAASFCSH